ncbi:hypothetical protein ACP4OV_020761 [Aristida adscensionis]
MEPPAAAFLVVVLLSCIHGAYSGEQKPGFASIFSFGDSYADTGNFLRLAAPFLPSVPINNPPYGETFFGHPTGRVSDGRLVLDFIADGLGLPFLPPVSAKGSDFSTGVNFAVGAAPALNLTYLQGQNITVKPPINSSLHDQLRWFEELKPSLCRDTPGYSGCFSKSLFIVGEFGANDYIYSFTSNKTIEQTRSYVPVIIDTISDGVERLIHHGAEFVVVADMFPIGCLPAIQTAFASPDKADYDGQGCLKSFNTMVSQYHNSLLRPRVEALRSKYPHTKIVAAEYYQPVIAFLQDPDHFGFDRSKTLAACCGGGGPYNYDPKAACGAPGRATACAAPSKAIFWDGFHLTDSGYRNIADGWLHGPYAHPPILDMVN